MYPLFESIKVQDRRFYNLELHVKRMNDSIEQYYKMKGGFDISDFSVPPDLTAELYKCRVLYDPGIRNIEFQKYTRKKIRSVKLVEQDNFDYSFKTTNRSQFDRLFSQYPGFDDFIIVKNNKLTDSTFSNLAFYDGEAWYTPSDFLLAGTKRKFLLNTGKIRESEISINQLSHYQKVCFINAMLDLGDSEVEIADIEI